jgi:hypothetical protein
MKKKHEPRSVEIIRSKALKQGNDRAEAVVTAVQSAMRMIDQELEANDGIYPNNGGALSLNELTRRADVHATTLFGKKYKGLKSDVDKWLSRIKSTGVVTRLEAQKSVTKRIAEWRDLYEALLRSHRKTELDLQQTTHLLEEARATIAHIEAAKAGAAEGVVVRLQPRSTFTKKN